VNEYGLGYIHYTHPVSATGELTRGFFFYFNHVFERMGHKNPMDS
jgi:hypothetical protein